MCSPLSAAEQQCAILLHTLKRAKRGFVYSADVLDTLQEWTQLSLELDRAFTMDVPLSLESDENEASDKDLDEVEDDLPVNATGKRHRSLRIIKD